MKKNTHSLEPDKKKKLPLAVLDVLKITKWYI